MRTLTSLVLFLTTVCSLSAQTKNPFQNLKFDKVIFYDFEENAEKGSFIVDNNGKPLQRLIKQVQPDTTTIKALNSKLGDKRSYGHGTAACFDPHCGFVYFLKGKPIAQVTICLGCNRLRSTIEIPAQKQGKHGQGKDAYYLFDGLSKSFRQYINNTLRKYNFSHQIEPGSAFDR
jgi:hypothetical protein